jgi:hypothetical protein
VFRLLSSFDDDGHGFYGARRTHNKTSIWHYDLMKCGLMWNTRNGTNRGFKRRYMSTGCGWMQSNRPRISPWPNEATRTIDSAPVTTAGLYASKMHFNPRRWANLRLKDATGCSSPGIPAFSVVQRQRRNLHAMGTLYLAMLRRSSSRTSHLTSLSLGVPRHLFTLPRVAWGSWGPSTYLLRTIDG